MEEAELRLQLETCHDQSYRWALHCCERDRVEAEDVLQIAYLKVLDGRARFDGRSSFSTWLFAVIRRTAADERRVRILRFKRHTPLADDVPLSGNPGAVEASERAERRARLRAALDVLPRRQREVLLLVFYHERTVEEAAKVMGIGLGSARTHYARGKQRLRELLDESGDGDDR